MNHIKELHQLIHALSKGEKRAFTLKSMKVGNYSQKIYTRIFKTFLSQQTFDEQSLRQSLAGLGLNNNATTVNRNLINQLLNTVVAFDKKKDIQNYFDLRLMQIRWMDAKGLNSLAQEYADDMLIDYSLEEFPAEYIKLCELRVELIRNYSSASRVEELIDLSEQAMAHLKVKFHVRKKQIELYAMIQKLNSDRSELVQNNYVRFLNDKVNTTENNVSSIYIQEQQNELNMLYYSIAGNYKQVLNYTNRQLQLYTTNSLFQTKFPDYYYSLQNRKMTCELQLNKRAEALLTLKTMRELKKNSDTKDASKNVSYQFNIADMELRFLFFEKKYDEIIQTRKVLLKRISLTENAPKDKIYAFTFYWGISFLKLKKYPEALKAIDSVLNKNSNELSHWDYTRHLKIVLLNIMIAFEQKKFEALLAGCNQFNKMIENNKDCNTEALINYFLQRITTEKSFDKAGADFIKVWSNLKTNPLEWLYMDAFAFFYNWVEEKTK